MHLKGPPPGVKDLHFEFLDLISCAIHTPLNFAAVVALVVAFVLGIMSVELIDMANGNGGPGNMNTVDPGWAQGRPRLLNDSLTFAD